MSDKPDQPTGRVATRSLLRRHLALVATTTCLVTAGAYGFAALQQPTYTAHATVLIQPYTLPTAANPAPDMGTEQAIAVSGVVLGNTARALHVPVTTVTAAADVSISTVANVLDFGYSAPTGVAAARGSTALAAAYMAYRAIASTTIVPRKQNPTQTLATPQVRTRLISPASVPGSPSSPDLVIDLIAGLVVGLVAGFGLALLTDRYGQRLRSSLRWQEATGVPVLAGLQRDVPLDGSPPGPTVTADATEAVLSYLRARAGQLLPHGHGVLLVTSVGPQPERAALARALVDGMAQAGSTAALLEVGSEERDAARLQLRESATAQDGGALRPAGDWSSIRLDRLLARIEQARADNEVVVVTGPPVPVSVTTLDVAGVADVAIVVDDLGAARRDAARQAVAELRGAGCPVGGAVVIGVPTARTGVAVVPATAVTPATARPPAMALRPAGGPRSRIAPLLAWSSATPATATAGADGADQRQSVQPHVNGSLT